MLNAFFVVLCKQASWLWFVEEAYVNGVEAVGLPSGQVDMDLESIALDELFPSVSSDRLALVSQ
jgi:hypothetical protein